LRTGCVVVVGVVVWAGTIAVSRKFHTRFTRYQRHGARRLRLDQGRLYRRSSQL